MRKRLIAVLLIPLAMIQVVGLGYALWTDAVALTCLLTTGNVDVEIGSLKLLSPYDDVLITVTQPNKDTLQVSSGIEPGWYVWVGLLIHNKGSLSVEVAPLPIWTDNPDLWNEYFEYEEYFYGPYNEGDFTEVWAPYPPETPPPPGEVTPPSLNPRQKMVVWGYLYFKEDYPGDSFTIRITVTYVAAHASWQDLIYVDLTLTTVGGE